MGHWCDMHLSLQYGYTPLTVASLRGRDGCVKLLLDRGAEVDHQPQMPLAYGNAASRQWQILSLAKGGTALGLEDGKGVPPRG